MYAPFCSLFGFIVLHMAVFSANIYYWRRYRVNYSFIFGFKKGTELGYRQSFLMSSGVAVLALAGVLSNLDMEMDPSTRSFRALTELVPLGLVIVRIQTEIINTMITCLMIFFIIITFSGCAWYNVMSFQHNISFHPTFPHPMCGTLCLCSSVQGN